MSIREIHQLIKNGESETLEFKVKANHPDKIVKEVVAFANTRGGKLLIGVSDDRRIVGLKSAEEDHYTLEKAITQYCFPEIKYHCQIIPVTARRSIIIYTIFESESKPHSIVLDDRNKRRQGYIRLADRSVKASKEMKEILRRERKAKAIRFTYGEKEKVLLNYLDKHEFITLNNFAQIAGIRPYLASRTLVTLVLAKVLRIIPREGEDWYRFNGITA